VKHNRPLAKETAKSIKQLGGKETVNSGVNNGDGDFVIDLLHPICWNNFNRVVGESKFTHKKSISIKREVLDKIRKQTGVELPVLHIGFVAPTNNKHYIIIEQKDFRDILDYIEYLHYQLFNQTRIANEHSI